MKKILSLILIFGVLASLAACGDTEYVDLTTQMNQDQEWREQAEEISLLLNDALKDEFLDIFGIEAKVYNTSGSIHASAEILDEQTSSAGFGSIAALLGNRFLELVDEYSEYSFDNMTFFYYFTNRIGNKSGDPYMVYNLKADGTGSLIVGYSGEKSVKYLSPDEAEAFLSDAP